MNIDLDNLSIDDIKKFSFSEMSELVDALEKVKSFDATEVESVDKLPDYRDMVELIQRMIEKNRYTELKSDKTREKMVSRLFLLSSSFSLIIDTRLYVRKQLNQIKNLDEKEQKFEERVNQTAQNVEDKLESSEHEMLTHMITLMGVFSAIITIVMSLVLTSSSWLNNSNGASALLAFVVPAFIVILSISFLLLIIYGYNTSSVFFRKGNEGRRKYYILFFASLLLVMVAAGALLFFTVSRHTSEKSQLLHSRYVLSPGEYDVSCSLSNDEDCYYYSFVIDGKEYVFAYDDTYKHDEYLYYCIEHNTLE